MQTLQSHQTNAYAAWSPDGSVIAVTADPSSTKAWNSKTSSLITTIPNSGPIAFSPDGALVAVADHHNSSRAVEIRDVASGERRWTAACNGVTHAVVFSPERAVTATSSYDGNHDPVIRLWDSKGGTCFRTMKCAHKYAWVGALAISPDGKKIAAGATTDHPEQVNLQLWDAKSGDKIHDLRGHHQVYTLRWLPDGKTLVSTGKDALRGSIRYWDTDAGICLRMFPAPDEAVLMPGETISAAPWTANGVQLADAKTGQLLRGFVALSDGKFLTLTAEGHYRGSPGIERDIVYVVQTDAGQETLTPEEFSQRYGWKNDPEKVSLVGAPEATGRP
jgi:WD40 repeat protein